MRRPLRHVYHPKNAKEIPAERPWQTKYERYLSYSYLAQVRYYTESPFGLAKREYALTEEEFLEACEILEVPTSRYLKEPVMEHRTFMREP